MNYLAVFVVVILNHLLGFLWYGVLFANPWMAAVGRTQADLKPTSMPYIVAFISSATLAVILSKVIRITNTRAPLEGAKLGALMWLGFILPVLATHYLFLGYGLDLICIDAAKELVSVLLAGGILAGWRQKLSQEQLINRI